MKNKKNINHPPERGKRLWQRLLCLCLLSVLCWMIPMGVRADEEEIIVNAKPGGGIPIATSGASGAYDIYDDDGYTLGFRFTLVDADDNQVGDVKDVYENEYFSSFLSNHPELVTMYDSSSNTQKIKLSKMEYISMYASEPYYNYVLTTSSSVSEHVDGEVSFLDSAIGISLPSTAAAMASWPKTDNLEALIPALWDISLDKAGSNQYSIAVEPIYAIRIGGEYFALTVAEIAINAVVNGTAYSGTPSWTAMTSSSSDTSSFQRLTQYTHGTWPMQLRLEEDAFGIDVSEWRDLSPTPQSERGTAKEIIEGNYGIMQIMVNDHISSYTNTIAFFAGEFSNGEGNGTDTNWLYVGEKTFTAENGSSVTMNAARSITVPHGHSLMTTFGTSGLTGSWKRYTMPYTFTQPENNVWMEYDFLANSYDITYVLNSGKNSSSNPSTYNIYYGFDLVNPTRTGYTFTGWTATTGAEDVSIPANTSNYHYTNLLRNLEPGTSHILTVDSNGGTAPGCGLSGRGVDFTGDTGKRRADLCRAGLS